MSRKTLLILVGLLGGGVALLACGALYFLYPIITAVLAPSSTATPLVAIPTTSTSAFPPPTSLPPGFSTIQPSQPHVYRIDATESEATYRVPETFFDIRGRVTAVGTTKGINGEIHIDRANPAQSRVPEVTVNLGQLRSDDPQRDDPVRFGLLNTNRFPLATFKNGVIQGLAADLAEGRPFTFQLIGDLTVKGVTQTLTWDVEATLEGDTLRGKATTRVTLTQFGIEVPNLRLLRAEDEAHLMLAFVAHATAPAASIPTATRPICTVSGRVAGPNESVPFAPLRNSVGTGHVLAGVVRSAADCTPIQGAHLIVWLANPQGVYDDDHTATVITDTSGAFSFESNYPGAYDNVRPHIHVYIYAPGHGHIITEALPSSGATLTRLNIVLPVEPAATATLIP